MPPSKKTAKGTAKRVAKKGAVKKPAKTRAKKPMSAEHRKALAAGRSESAAVNDYLAAINTPKKRGRRIPNSVLQTRLKAAEERARTAIGVEKVVLHQEVRNLRARLAATREHAATDIEKLEKEFCNVAKRFSDRRGIRYGAWRDAGVSAEVLKRAGVQRTRG